MFVGFSGSAEMELELGLSLPNSNPKIPILKELDLISYVIGKANQVCDDTSTVSSQSSVNCDDEVEGNEEEDDDDDDDDDGVFGLNKKRSFSEAFEEESCVSSQPKTLPLLFWDKDPNEQGNDPNRLSQLNSHSMAKDDGDGIVGWPPIKSYRKKVHQRKDGQHHHIRCQGGNFPAVEHGGGSQSQSTYVKVQMEGFGITRKVDLKLYHSYDSLTYSLINMFGKGQQNLNEYKLTYQDREGDWLLAGDLPWKKFSRSVQRFKLIRRED